MITIGIAAHKGVHMAVALNDAGQAVAQWRGANTPAGWDDVARWATGLGQPRQWGIEGAWGYGRGLAQHLVRQGETVFDINPRWTAEERRRARSASKSDRLDARAVALLVWREDVTLPRVTAEDESAILEVLTTERENALAEATRLRNQLHHLLLHLDPEYRRHLPRLDSKAGLRAVEGYTTTSSSAVQQERAAAVRRIAQRLRLALEQAEDLAKQIERRAQARFSPLTTLCGVSLLTAGTLAGILGPGQRFATDGQRAAYAGAAPSEPQRQPPAQCHSLAHCADPTARAACRARLCGPAHRGGQDHTRSRAGPQTLHHSGDLAAMAGLRATGARPGRAAGGLSRPVSPEAVPYIVAPTSGGAVA